MKKIRKFIKLIIKYLLSNKLISLVGLYFVVSIFLDIFFEVDILIPCLWRTIFKFKCLGCGLTTAFMHLLKFDITEAYYSNPLIFIVLPAGIFFIVKDIIKFAKKQNVGN